jgi:Fe-S cluster assembly protein SufD
MQTSTKQVTKLADLYRDKFEQFREMAVQREPDWVASLRQSAFSSFVETGFPTVQDEDWRFTNVAPIARLPFNPVFSGDGSEIDPQALAQLTFASLKGHKLVFVNGQYAPGLSSVNKLENGVRILSLAEVLRCDPEFIEGQLGRNAQGHNPFLALNTAFFSDGVVIHVPAGTVLREPVQLLHLSTADHPGMAAHPRYLIIAEKDSQLTVLENYAGLSNRPSLTNAVTELVLGENATVEHCKFQDESLAAFHMAAVDARLARNANLISHSFALGARLSRNNIRTLLNGEGVECVLNGLYLTRDDQLADHHMIVDHAQPHCNSHEYFNGILQDRSRGVFHGRIFVRPEAQKTDAKQTNKNLLLSNDATANTKPQLEIYADDVKCTHGATVGQLNEESIFYLRARGIGADMARRMLIHAFAGEIIERIRCEPARDELDKLVWERLEQNQEIAVARPVSDWLPLRQDAEVQNPEPKPQPDQTYVRRS